MFRMTEEEHQAWKDRQVAPAESALRKAIKLTRPTIPESAVLDAVLKTLLLHPKVKLAWRVNSGAGKFLYPDGSTSQFMRFGFPGCPDIHGVMHGGRALFVECKRRGEKPTDDQAAFLAKMKSAGAVAFVAYLSDDVMRELERA